MLENDYKTNWALVLKKEKSKALESVIFYSCITKAKLWPRELHTGHGCMKSLSGVPNNTVFAAILILCFAYKICPLHHSPH